MTTKRNMQRLEVASIIESWHQEKINLQFAHAHLDNGGVYQSVRVFHHALRVSTFIKSSPKKHRSSGVRGKSIDEERSRLESMRRAKSNIIALTLGNAWTWWCTFTFKEQHHDIDSAYNSFRKVYKQLMAVGVKLTYLIVPEKHEKGGYHFHALMQGNDFLFAPQIKQTGIHAGKQYLDKAGRPVYDFKPMIDLGFTNCVRIDATPESFMATAHYIGNYVTKQKADEFNKHRYYASRGLSKGKTILVTKVSPSELTRVVDGVEFKEKIFINDMTGEKVVLHRSKMWAIESGDSIELTPEMFAVMCPDRYEPVEYKRIK